MSRKNTFPKSHKSFERLLNIQIIGAFFFHRLSRCRESNLLLRRMITIYTRIIYKTLAKRFKEHLLIFWNWIYKTKITYIMRKSICLNYYSRTKAITKNIYLNTLYIFLNTKVIEDDSNCRSFSVISCCLSLTHLNICGNIRYNIKQPPFCCVWFNLRIDQSLLCCCMACSMNS